MSLSSTQKLVIAAVCLFGVATYFLASTLRSAPSAVPALNQRESSSRDLQPIQAAVRTARCVASADPSTSQQELLEMRTHIIDASHRQAYAETLPELRRIAALDPGYPGLNLDIAMSLLDLKKPEQARTALDTQIRISECLSRLPPEELATYCRDEAFQRNPDRCREQLQTILHSAYLGTELVQAEMGRAVPANLVEDPPKPQVVAKTPTPKVRIRQSPTESPDRTLALGAGTDAQLGAYSK